MTAQNRSLADSGNGDNLDVYMVVIGPGPVIYSWWGHIGLVIGNRSSGAEYLYDYGNFDFDTEDFYRNFAMGRLWFSMFRFPFSTYVSHTKSQNRSLRIHQLDLDARQKLWLLDYLETNFLPENRSYLYHHYKDNCSTRIRDILDTITEGAISRAVAKPVGSSPTTLRQLSRRYADHSAAGYWIINFLLSGSNDLPAGGWEELFIPDYMERAIDLAGLILRSASLHDSNTYPLPGEPQILRYHARVYMVIALLLLPIALLCATKRFLLLDIYRSLILLIAAIPGSVLFFMMFFSDHDVTFGNWNILLASPLLLPAAGILLWSNRRSKAAARLRLGCSSVLCGLAVLGLVLARIPAWHQANISVTFNFLVVYVAFWFSDYQRYQTSGKQEAGYSHAKQLSGN